MLLIPSFAAIQFDKIFGDRLGDFMCFALQITTSNFYIKDTGIFI